MIERVRDLSKIVTDELVLKELAKQGIDAQEVEFFQDYAPRSLGKEHSPYAKFYRHLKSGKRIMAVSGLPMVKVMGHKIEVGWLYAKGKYYSKANLFSAIVKGKRVQVTCLSDQPSIRGHTRKAGDRVTYSPQLFLGGTELFCNPKPTLLPTDPINENYKENTLEWDYGVDRRRIRIIEGRIRDKWLVYFRGIYEIAHNASGDLPLRFGRCIGADGEPISVQVIGDREIVDTTNLPDSAFPVEIGGSPETFYPDEGVASVDGDVSREALNSNWESITTGAGTDADDSNVDAYIVFREHNIAGKWRTHYRSFFLFDTSPLPDTATISAGILSLRCIGKLDPDNNTPASNVYASSPASNTALAASDYNSVGSTALATAIAYADIVADAYNDRTLNQNGRDAIIKNGVSKFSLRNEYDYNATPPPNNDGDEDETYPCANWTTEKGTGFKPKLVVTYTVGVAELGAFYMRRNPFGINIQSCGQVRAG